MKYYPVFLQVTGRRCVVIGGGEVAERKVASLLAAGARVAVISPSLTPGLARRLAEGAIEYVARPYRRGDLAGALLAYAATDDESVHADIAGEAEAAGVLLNVVDRPARCGFIVPSILTRGELTVAVSTGGGSPALARRVREDLERALGPEYERALELLTRLRQHLTRESRSTAERKRILTELIGSNLLDLLREPNVAAVDRLLAEHVGGDVSLATLGAELR
jgi:precorrin-2 dehydrogenase/sirohydrochlorin ferrochelatase